MFANRFTAFIDACTLADTLRRNLLLTLAEAEFYRLRWSSAVLDETEAAIRKILEGKGASNASSKAERSRALMEAAFEDAKVDDYEHLLAICTGLLDPDDAHVLAAALKTQAAVIVTENLRDFPPGILNSMNMDARSADAFLADTIALDLGRAVASIRKMRERFRRPELSADTLLLEMEARGLTEAVNVLRPYAKLL